MIPIKREILDKSNEEIIDYITHNAKINVNYYPIIAMRTNENPLFENYLLEEMIKQDNFNEKFFGFIKIAWIPFLSILEYSNNSFLINKAIDTFNDWNINEKNNFLNYIKKDKKLMKYF